MFIPNEVAGGLHLVRFDQCRFLPSVAGRPALITLRAKVVQTLAGDGTPKHGYVHTSLFLPLPSVEVQQIFRKSDRRAAERVQGQLTRFLCALLGKNGAPIYTLDEVTADSGFEIDTAVIRQKAYAVVLYREATAAYYPESTWILPSEIAWAARLRDLRSPRTRRVTLPTNWGVWADAPPSEVRHWASNRYLDTQTITQPSRDFVLATPDPLWHHHWSWLDFTIGSGGFGLSVPDIITAALRSGMSVPSARNYCRSRNLPKLRYRWGRRAPVPKKAVNE